MSQHFFEDNSASLTRWSSKIGQLNITIKLAQTIEFMGLKFNKELNCVLEIYLSYDNYQREVTNELKNPKHDKLNSHEWTLVKNKAVAFFYIGKRGGRLFLTFLYD